MVTNGKKENFTGDDLRNMRLAAGKTMQQMANYVGIHRHTYENYEKRVSKFPGEYFFDWAKLCGWNLSAIYNYASQCRQIVNEQKLVRPRQKKADDEELKGKDCEEPES